METFFSSNKSGSSARGYTSCQVCATEFGYVFVVPMEGKSGIKILQAIKNYFKEIGVPLHLIYDQSREQVHGDARLLCNKSGCHVIELKKVIPAANREEISINILKYGCKRYMFDTNSPMVFWCYFN